VKYNKLVIFIIILSIVGTIIIYPYLPDIIPTHWGINGEVNGHGEKWVTFITASIPVFMYLLMYAVPFIDPKRENYRLHGSAYSHIAVAVISVIIAIHWLAIAVNFYKNLDLVLGMRIILGLLFIVIGKYIMQIRFNYFTGIKTPWTLANEYVWDKTHRKGGYGFMILGGIILATIFLNHTIGFVIMIAGVILLVVGTFAYSYVVFEKVKK